MSVLTARISYFGKEGLGSEKVLTDWTRVTIKRGLDTVSNTVEVKLKNSIYKRLSDGTTIHKYVSDTKELSMDGSTILQQGDVIKVWLRWSDSASDTITYDDSSSNLITVSTIQEWNCVLSDGKTELTLKCVDKTYEILNKLWAQSYTSTMAMTCPTMAINIIQNSTDGIGTVSGYDNFGKFTRPAKYGIDARVMSGTYAQQAALDIAATGDPPAYVESLRKNETAYPTLPMTKVWKPVYEWLREINDIKSTNSTTEIDSGAPPHNRNNRFYVDQRNRYHQFYPSDTVEYTITAGTASDDGNVAEFNMAKKSFDIINMVIFNAGKDLDNVGMLYYYFDRASKEKKLKMKYIPMLDIGSEGNGSMRSAEVAIGNISVASTGVVTILVSPGTTSWGVAYANDAAYKSEFRAHAISEGQKKAKAITSGRGNPRWKGNITIKKGAHYSAGQLVQFTALTHGINGQLVRILDVTHQITPTQWTSQLEVEADEPKYGET